MSSIPTALTFLESVGGYSQHIAKGSLGSAAQPILLAVIDPAYVATSYPTTLPKVTFEGEETLSDKRYPVVGHYTPVASDRVVMLPVGATFVILGSLSTPPAVQIQQADATGVVTTSSTSFVSLSGGPSVSLDLRAGQKAKVTVSCQDFSDTAGANGVLMSWRSTGASGTVEAADTDGHENGTVNEWTPMSRTGIFTASTAGSATFESRYRVIGTTTGNYKNRRITAEAL